MLRLTDIAAIHPGVTRLHAEAIEEGFRFVERLVSDWKSGLNRFDLPGESFLGVFIGSDLLGFCGLNRDPYSTQDAVCRLRHLYVQRNARRAGIGSALVQHLLIEGSATFRAVRVRTDSEDAAAFYLRQGFAQITDETASHVKMLGTR
jgi:GNAT superfamily N-acetyltransferase